MCALPLNNQRDYNERLITSDINNLRILLEKLYKKENDIDEKDNKKIEELIRSIIDENNKLIKKYKSLKGGPSKDLENIRIALVEELILHKTNGNYTKEDIQNLLNILNKDVNRRYSNFDKIERKRQLSDIQNIDINKEIKELSENINRSLLKSNLIIHSQPIVSKRILQEYRERISNIEEFLSLYENKNLPKDSPTQRENNINIEFLQKELEKIKEDYNKLEERPKLEHLICTQGNGDNIRNCDAHINGKLYSLQLTDGEIYIFPKKSSSIGL